MVSPFQKAFHLFIYETTRYISPIGIATEWVFGAIAMACTLLFPITAAGPANRLRHLFIRFARRKGLAIVTIGLLPVAVRMLMLPIAPVPKPSIHDEFSHLLLADTLGSGRLSNPPHRFWQHFETIHEIQQPTYSSMYPPLQGIFLAFGQEVFNQPWAGVLIGMGLMFMTICWMLQGWMPPEWALYGTFLGVLKFGIVGFWMNSYMGGGAPAIAGALVIGALPRIVRAERARYAVLMALGIVMLLNSRPFEGGVLTCCAFAFLIPKLRCPFLCRPMVFWRRVAAPAAAVLVLGLLFTGYYCWRVTGSPVRMAYSVNRDTYGWPENLAILPPKNVKIRHIAMQAMYEKELGNRNHYSSVARVLDNLDTRFFDSWTFYVGPALTFPLLVLPWVLREKPGRTLFLFAAAILLVNLLQLLLYPQHLAPICGVIVGLLTFGVRHIYLTVKRLAPVRAVYLLAALPILLSAVSIFKLEAEPLGITLSYWERAYEIHRDSRAALMQNLEHRPGKHLVIVRYSPFHPPDEEWVYNRANIDAAKVVWAREMDPKSDAQLINYFSDRHVWLLEPDAVPLRFIPYPVSSLLASVRRSAQDLPR
jgi:hypothetical protein